MIRCLRYYISGMEAGLIGMFAGVLGQVYIYELTDRPMELLQAASIFKEIDEVSFVVTLVSMSMFAFTCIVVEVKRYFRRRRKKLELHNKKNFGKN